MGLLAGTKLGVYEILSPLGAGGMGEVYRARDTKLNREVALKVLPESFAADPQRMARFEREAQVLASLNHPNIATIYGLEESGQTRALVMELVEGQTLAEKIHVAQGPPSGPAAVQPPKDVEKPQRRSAGVAVQVDDPLAVARQVAEALEYAHERGIIHRDLKPANIKITPEGAVKVLDFGLAKAMGPDEASRDISNSPTLSAAMTQAGFIIGTAAYMSPEQAKAKAVDRRADIWAFGCVLYEMLSGKKPFEGETVSDVLAAVIRADPDWTALQADTPPAIQNLIRRCLNKDPKQRLRDIGDARITIEDALSGEPSLFAPLPQAGEDGSVGRSRVRGQSILPWALTALAVGALISGLAVWIFTAPVPQPQMHFSAVTNFAGVQAQPAISPDGRSVAFVSNRDGNYNIYVTLVHGGSLVQITHDPNLESAPSWSPDGATLAYARLNHSGLWDIWQAPALGGTSKRLILNATDPDWSPDGHSLAYLNLADGGIWISGDSGENAHQVVPIQLPWYRDADPRFSPNGREVAFVVRPDGPYGELEVADLASDKVRQLTHDLALALSPAWSPDGQSIYFASSCGGTMNIWKIPEAGGEPEQITSGQGDDAELDISRDGRSIIFSTWRENINIARLDLDAPPGHPSVKLLTTDPARNQIAPVYSPDGKHLAYFSNLKGAEKEGIWVAKADGSDPVQVVQDNRVNIFPHWRPDNQHLVYTSESGDFGRGGDEYRSVPVFGGAPRTLLKNVTDLNPGVGADGRLLFWGKQGQVETFDPRTGKTQTLGTLPPSSRMGSLRWSPGERSVAYIVEASREDDPREGLWVDDFKNPPHQLFRGWVASYARGPGDEIYFLEGKPDLNGVLWKVQWNGRGLTRTSATIPLTYSYWEVPGLNSQTTFDVAPDGRHVAFTSEQILQANIGMIQNAR